MWEEEIVIKAFPSEIRENVNSLLTRLDISNEYATSWFENASLKGEGIQIPSRIYIEPPYSLNSSKFTSVEKLILNCLFSRHSNGYVRQEAIKNIISSDE